MDGVSLTGILISILLGVITTIITRGLNTLSTIKKSVEDYSFAHTGDTALMTAILDHARETERLIRELHAWHSPDLNGRQSWRDTGPVLERIQTTHELLSTLIKLIENNKV